MTSKLWKAVTARLRPARDSRGSRSEREAMLEASLAIVTDALVLFDETGAIRSVSRAAERLFGWPANELVGQHVRILTPAEDLSLDGHLHGDLGLDDDRILDGYRRIEGIHRDGTRFPVELRIGEVRTWGRRFFTAVVRDLTTLHEAERRAQELQAQLTQVWSLNSMGEMASVLAHELNQPLSAVANYMRAARNIIASLELEDDDLLDAVSRAGEQAVRAGEIIRTMRDLATRGGMQQRP